MGGWVCVRVRTHMHAGVCVCVHMHVCAHACMCACVCDSESFDFPVSRFLEPIYYLFRMIWLQDSEGFRVLRGSWVTVEEVRTCTLS